MIRRAAPGGRMDMMPADLRTWAERGPLETDPQLQDYRRWRRPHLDGPALFWYHVPGMEEYFHESANENWPDGSDMDVDMGDGDWFQLTGGAGEEQSYDLIHGRGRSGWKNGHPVRVPGT